MVCRVAETLLCIGGKGNNHSITAFTTLLKTAPAKDGARYMYQEFLAHYSWGKQRWNDACAREIPVRREATKALAALAEEGNVQVVDVLISELQTQYTLLRAAALKALVCIAERNDQRVLTALTAQLDDTSLKESALEGLVNLTEEFDERIIREIKELASRAINSCSIEQGRNVTNLRRMRILAIVGKHGDYRVRSAVSSLFKATDVSPLFKATDMSLHKQYIDLYAQDSRRLVAAVEFLGLGHAAPVSKQTIIQALITQLRNFDLVCRPFGTFLHGDKNPSCIGF